MEIEYLTHHLFVQLWAIVNVPYLNDFQGNSNVAQGEGNTRSTQYKLYSTSFYNTLTLGISKAAYIAED